MSERKRAVPDREKLQKEMMGDLAGTRLLIEYQDYYEEDYQIVMLRNNLLPHILQMEVDGIGNVSRFSYDVGGMCSMKTDFEQQKISFEDLKLFLEQFLETVEEMKSYMLCPDCLWLEPECIYQKEKVYRFCYFPVIQVPLQKQFHDLTDYWVHKIDYQDIECVFLAHKLNRGTLEEQCDIRALLEEYGKEADDREKAGQESRDRKKTKQEKSEQEQENNKRGNPDMLFMEEEQEIPESVCPKEMPIRGKRKGILQKATAYIKRPWGQWEDLLQESREVPCRKNAEML